MCQARDALLWNTSTDLGTEYDAVSRLENLKRYLRLIPGSSVYLSTARFGYDEKTR